MAKSASLNLHPLLTKRALDLSYYYVYSIVFSCAVWVSLAAACLLAYYSPFLALSAMPQLYFAPVFLVTYLSTKTLSHYYHLQGFIQSRQTTRIYQYSYTLATWSLGLTLCLSILPYISTIPALIPFIPLQIFAFLKAIHLASFSASIFFTLATFLYLSFANFCIPTTRNNYPAIKPNHLTALEKRGLFHNHLAPFMPILPADTAKLSNLINNGILSSYPLEIALGFMDFAIFKECYQNHPKTDPYLMHSCQYVLVMINTAIQSSQTQNLPLSRHCHDILTQIRDYIIIHNPHSILATSCENTQFIYHQDELYRFPSIARTLAQIPLPSNTQYEYLSTYKLRNRHQKLCASFAPLSQSTHNSQSTSGLVKKAFDYLNTAFSQIPIDHLTPSFSILKKRLSVKLASTDPIQEQRKIQLAYLFIKIAKHAALFQDALSASLALNHPGRPISLQRKKSGKSLVMHLGISLVARSLTYIQITEAFLNSLPSVSLGISFHPVYADLRKICFDLESNIFLHLNMMSTGSTLPRFLILHSGRKNRPRDIVQNNKTFSYFFTTNGMKQAAQKTSASMIQESDIVRQALQRLPYTKPFVSTSYQYGNHNTGAKGSHNILHVLSIWSQLETPRLPFWYHCTGYDNAASILNANQINVGHKVFSGAFISTNIETSYGDIAFALSHETALMSNIYNTTGHCERYIWHGCAKPIRLNPHLVAIGYPVQKQPDVLKILRKTGTVIFNSEGAPLLFTHNNHRVFLFTREELAALRSLLLQSNMPVKDTASTQSRQNSSAANMFPTPRYLAENTVYGNSALPTDLNPLKTQLDNCNRVLNTF